MTEEMKAFLDGQHAMGFIQGATTDMDDPKKNRVAEALSWLNRSLETLLEAAEKPEAPPAEEASPLWHRTTVMGKIRVLPELEEFVLTWSKETDKRQVLKCTDIDLELWQDEDGDVYTGRVDYWMHIPLIEER